MNCDLLVLSGPNLDQLGTRSPEIYGTTTLVEHVERLRRRAESWGWTLEHRQSNYEGDLIVAAHEARAGARAIIVNAGALSHVSWALTDALAMFPGPVVEVHLSNPAAREPFRHVSTLAPVVAGTIAGFSALSYDLALSAVATLLGVPEAL